MAAFVCLTLRILASDLTFVVGSKGGVEQDM